MARFGVFGGGGRSRTDYVLLMKQPRLLSLLPAKQPGVVRSLEDGVSVFSFNPSSRAGRWTGSLVTTPIVSLLWNIRDSSLLRASRLA